MASLGKITGKRVKATLEIAPGETLTLFHNPAKLTPELESYIRDTDTIQGAGCLVEIIGRCLLDWDLRADNAEDAEEFGVAVGDIIPATRDSLLKLPTEFLIEIGNKLKKEQAPDPNPTTPKPSGSFS